LVVDMALPNMAMLALTVDPVVAEPGTERQVKAIYHQDPAP
jgi:hypothetical protein